MRGSPPRPAWIPIVLCLGTQPGCGDVRTGDVGSPETSASAATVAPAGDSVAWTIGVIDVESTVSSSPLPVLTALRTQTRPDSERLTVEIAGGSEMPGYRLEYIDRPLHDCGSGREIHPVGDAWLELRLEPAAAHTEEGAPTLGARDIAVDAPLLLRLYRTCDFEGVVTLVLALSAPNRFRATTATDPPRVIVDVQR